MSEIIYREATLDDCYEIAYLKGEVWNTTYRNIYPDEMLDNYDILKNESTFQKIISNPNLSLYVAVDLLRIIGFMSCGEPYRPFCDYKQEIGLLYILENYQKRGIGKSLFNIGKNKINANGFTEFFVSVNKYNNNALDFYILLGGKIVHVDDDDKDKRNVQIKLHYTV